MRTRDLRRVWDYSRRTKRFYGAELGMKDVCGVDLLCLTLRVLVVSASELAVERTPNDVFPEINDSIVVLGRGFNKRRSY